MTYFFVYGIHAVAALLNNPYREIKRLLITNQRHDQRLQPLLDAAQARAIPIDSLSQTEMSSRFEGLVHQGIVAEAGALPDYHEADLDALLERAKQPPFILLLDGITDPHNLGACLRTADATGVDFVIIPKDKNASITPVVSKVACGAAESVPLVRVTNLVRTMEFLKQKGIWIYGAAGEAAQNVYNLDARSAIAIVLGAEGAGLRRLTREHCDGLFSLPMLGSVESLNVSVACGVSLYEIVRQRLNKI